MFPSWRESATWSPRVWSSLHTAFARQAPTLSGRMVRVFWPHSAVIAAVVNSARRRLINMNEAAKSAVCCRRGCKCIFRATLFAFYLFKMAKTGVALLDITARRLSPPPPPLSNFLAESAKRKMIHGDYYCKICRSPSMCVPKLLLAAVWQTPKNFSPRS